MAHEQEQAFQATDYEYIPSLGAQDCRDGK